MSQKNTLRRIAALEAMTLIVLVFVAVPLKHFAGMPEATRFMGPIHGLAFLAFCWSVLREYSEGEVSKKDLARLMIGAFIPFGGLVNERWLKRRDFEASNRVV
ncbi:DUF3817 domain-containing protein [Agrobacterium larrymoorei]|uniref:DUF3817 domain-containing protein n=1 Tax=Agrobacterium larrymoorei TaxID=160699 RepID=UPI001573D5E8|nr:DUF3817 domain-containing protein [Agrobacterium larrymoorei]NTJ45326.1 DUF3817 domain-containing protein [Agrobacterium larrymoorei]